MKTLFVLILITLQFTFTCIKAQSWAQLGTGSNSLNCTAGTIYGGGLYDLESDDQGNIYVAGQFFDSNGRNYIAKWSGSSWDKFGGSIDTSLLSMAFVMCKEPSGSIYVTGPYQSGKPPRILRSSGGSWLNICAGSNPATAGSFLTLCTDPQGNLYCGGTFKNSSNLCFVAKWNGSSWTSLGNGPPSNPGSIIRSICSDANGNIYAAGMLKNASGNYYVAKWNGSNWSELGTGANALNANDQIYSIISDHSGNIFAGGIFKNDSNYTYVAKWNGSSWAELGGTQHMLKGLGEIKTLLTEGNNVYAAGSLLDSALNNRYVAKWNGTSWTDLGKLNATADILSLCADPAGNIYATGLFVNNQDYVYVAKYGTGSVGIPHNGLDIQNEIGVWPNPSKSNFTIQLNENTKEDFFNVEIITISGQVIYKRTISSENMRNSFDIKIENYAAGIYTLRVFNEEVYHTRKLILTD
jgi:hypothetical protein